MRGVILMCAVLGLAACYLSYGQTPPRECESSSCGCFDKKHMVFTGVVMDAYSHECIAYKLVRLRDRDGTVVAEDTTRSPGSYRVEGDVERSPHCPGGEPTIREDLPAYEYLPRRTPVDDNAERVDLLRVPLGVQDAGWDQPLQCRVPRGDAGMGDAG